jgi:hypothetical protein
VKGLWASNVSWLNIGTGYAAQSAVEEVFGEHWRLIWRNLPFFSQKGFSKSSLTFFPREFNYGKPLQAVKNDSDTVDIYYGGWLFSGGHMRWMLIVCRKGGSRI